MKKQIRILKHIEKEKNNIDNNMIGGKHEFGEQIRNSTVELKLQIYNITRYVGPSIGPL